MPTKPVLEGDPNSSENQNELEEYECDVKKWKSQRFGAVYFISELLKVGIINMCLTTLLKEEATVSGEGTGEISCYAINVSHAAEMLKACHDLMKPPEIQKYNARNVNRGRQKTTQAGGNASGGNNGVTNESARFYEIRDANINKLKTIISQNKLPSFETAVVQNIINLYVKK